MKEGDIHSLFTVLPFFKINLAVDCPFSSQKVESPSGFPSLMFSSLFFCPFSYQLVITP